jgi:SAM-dependent methyltransferase
MTKDDIKESIKEHYGKIAAAGSSCCAPNCGCASDSDEQLLSVMMSDEYKDVDDQIIAAADLGLGCGTPTAFTDLQPGMTVLDLGSGAGIDVFIAANAVAPNGKAIGLDMTDEMLDRARTNKAKLGITNAEFLKGEIEDMPVESGSIDRIISNCVINLVPDKREAFAEMYRVLRKGGKFTISDIVSIGTIPESVRKIVQLWAGCVSGAVEKDEYLKIIREAGFEDIEVVSEKKYATIPGLPFSILSVTVRGTK